MVSSGGRYCCTTEVDYGGKSFHLITLHPAAIQSERHMVSNEAVHRIHGEAFITTIGIECQFEDRKKTQIEIVLAGSK